MQWIASVLAAAFVAYGTRYLGGIVRVFALLGASFGVTKKLRCLEVPGGLEIKKVLDKLKKMDGVYAVCNRLVGGEFAPCGWMVRIGGTSVTECFVAYVGPPRSAEGGGGGGGCHPDIVLLFGHNDFLRRSIFDERPPPPAPRCDEDEACGEGNGNDHHHIQVIANTSGSYAYAFWTKMTSLPCEFLRAKEGPQTAVVEAIVAMFIERRDRESKGTVALVYGPGGTGKSTVGLLVAKALKAQICLRFDPTEPGALLEELLATASPSRDTPFVIVIDEGDVMWGKAAKGDIRPHPTARTTAIDKGGINRFMDDLSGMIGCNVCTVITSNSDPQTIVEQKTGGDPSYIRDDRVNGKYEIR